jgi:hypothetical protein
MSLPDELHFEGTVKVRLQDCRLLCLERSGVVLDVIAAAHKQLKLFSQVANNFGSIWTIT